jgi:hypothetical protein
VPFPVAHQIGKLPPVGSLFAAFLGYNPIHQLLAPTGVLAKLPASHAARLTSKSFFPQLISGPFHHGLVIVFSMAIVVLLIAAGISLLRGGHYVHEEAAAETALAATAASAPVAAAGPAADATEIAGNEGQPDGAARNGDQPRTAVRAADGRATPDA